MRNLRKLNCSKLGHFKDSDLFVIGTCFPLLEDLDISFTQYNSRFNPNGSLDLQSFSGVIDFSGNHFITDKSLHALSLNCVLLSEVVVRDYDFITQNGISMVMRNSANLNSISLEESFTYAKTLCELHLSNSFISDELLCYVAEACLPLKKLTISQCYNFSFVGISCLLYRYQFLEHFDVQGANFLTAKSMIELSNFLGKLIFINLDLCSKLASLTFFALIRNCPLLEDVRMERTNLAVEEFMVDLVINHILSDECLKKAALCCPSFQVLEISYCPTITEEGIKEVLRNCRKIRHLEMNRLQGPGIDDEALAIIAKRCQKLLHLDLECCLNVTAKGVKEVVQNWKAVSQETKDFYREEFKVTSFFLLYYFIFQYTLIIKNIYSFFFPKKIFLGFF
ncbi:hypothetical protein P3X46_018120 [Hevea brasiliensis]|uniref:Uncharacterized protein n=1 Tax=Hevea brasiliensis TaxID=3981 RepID=A0ABQ9LR13_HEVBR|nr:hypothetical protein P3X46_018120 [Hevea brasiliensis]